MRAPEIDFALRPPSQRMLAPILAAAAAVFLGVSVWEYTAAARDLERIDSDIRASASSAQRRGATPPAAPMSRLPQQALRAVNGAIARLNVPWSDLFAAFETDKRKDVALLALLPDARRRSLMVQGEATTPQAMLDFVEHLRTVELFEDAFLVKHERREQQAGQPYRFAVVVRWREHP
jgi:hypothetical protein